MKLCLIATDACPGAGEIVRHEIDVVDYTRHCSEIDVLEDILADGKSGGEKMCVFRKDIAAFLEEFHIVVAFLRVFRMFPINYYGISKRSS